MSEARERIGREQGGWLHSAVELRAHWRAQSVSDERPTPDVDDPVLEDEELAHVEDDSPPPEGPGPAASPEDFEPEDPDSENAEDSLR